MAVHGIPILALALALATSGCGLFGDDGGGHSKHKHKEGSGGIAAQARWPMPGFAVPDPLSHAALPAAVSTVRATVSAADMTAVTKDFAASAGTGTIDDVPVGTGRSLSLQGLNSSGAVIYQATIPNITVTSGATTPAGTANMVFVGPGGFDLTFSADGFLVDNDGPNIGSPSNGGDQGLALAFDGTNIVVGGSSEPNVGGYYTAWKYGNDGTPSSVLASPGKAGAVQHFTGATNTDTPRAMTVDSGGNIYLTGSSTSTAGFQSLVVLKLLPSGSLDSSFTGDGIQIFPSALASDAYEGKGLAVHDGKLFVTGSFKQISTTSGKAMAIWRSNATFGTFDLGLGTGFGSCTATCPGYILSDDELGGPVGVDGFGSAIALDSQNRIVVAGQVDGNAITAAAVWRRVATSDNTGSIDPGFNTTGFKSDIPFGSFAFANAVAIESSDNVVVAGGAGSPGASGFFMWRFLSAGTLDLIFDAAFQAGAMTLCVNSQAFTEEGRAVAVDAQGRIVVAGVCKPASTPSSPSTLFVMRLLSSGALDTSFGEGLGAIFFTIDNLAIDARDMKLDASGKIVVTGSFVNGSANDMILLRINP